MENHGEKSCEMEIVYLTYFNNFFAFTFFSPFFSTHSLTPPNAAATFWFRKDLRDLKERFLFLFHEGFKFVLKEDGKILEKFELKKWRNWLALKIMMMISWIMSWENRYKSLHQKLINRIFRLWMYLNNIIIIMK